MEDKRSESIQWVPASERFPDYTDDYLVAVDVYTGQPSYGDVRVARYVKKTPAPFGGDWYLSQATSEIATLQYWADMPELPEAMKKAYA